MYDVIVTLSRATYSMNLNDVIDALWISLQELAVNLVNKKVVYYQRWASAKNNRWFLLRPTVKLLTFL